MTKHKKIKSTDPAVLKDYTFYGFNKQIVADAMVNKMRYVIEEIQRAADEIMNAHGAKFVFIEDEPEHGFESDRWLDNEMFHRAQLEAIRQIIGYLFQCLPPVIEKYEAPFILPHQLVHEHTKQWFDDMTTDTHDAREILWKQHCMENMEADLEDETDAEKRMNYERIIAEYRREIERLTVYEVVQKEFEAVQDE